MIPLLILAADAHLYHPENLRALAEGYQVRDGRDWRGWSQAQLLDCCRDVEVIITARRSPRLPDELIADRGRLRWLCHLHGTVRHLVSRAHIEAGLLVSNWGDAPRPVAQGTVALLLATLHQIPGLDRYARTGTDRRVAQEYLTDLTRMRVGLYGYGPVGRQVGAKLLALGTNLAICDPYAADVPAGVTVCRSLGELFSTCQAVIVICGLNDQTRGSVTRGLLERLPQGGVLVNVARGPIVDEQALAELVDAGRILAGCDVICDESDWPGSPLAAGQGAILTRHHVGVGMGRPPHLRDHKRLPGFALDNLAAYRCGRPLKYLITPQMYDLKT